MDFRALMYVGIGGAFGSMCRYLMAVWLGRLSETSFPYPTLVINITGSFLMGVWIGVMALLLPGRSKDLHLLMAVGVLGGYTTFSTFSLEAYMLLEKGLWLQAGCYIAGSVVLSVAGLFTGMWVLRMIAA